MSGETEAVLDASALIALLWEEPGAEAVEPLLGRAAISTVNMAEVLQRYSAVDLDATGRQESVAALGIEVEEFTGQDAETTAGLWKSTRRMGLSLADRACLALASRLGLPALTADTEWSRVDLGIDVILIR